MDSSVLSRTPPLEPDTRAALEPEAESRQMVSRMSISQLVALRYVPEAGTSVQDYWHPYKRHLVPVEACARHLMLGEADKVLAHMPPAFEERVNEKFFGADAYYQVLRIAVGLESPKRERDSIAHYMLEAFDEYDRLRRGLQTESLYYVFDRILNDAKDIRNKVMAGLAPYSVSTVTRSLAACDSGSVVVLIAGDEEKVREMLRVLGGRDEERVPVREILLTHPDAAKRSKAEGIVNQFRKRGDVDCEITIFEYDPSLIPVAFGVASHIFACDDLQKGDVCGPLLDGLPMFCGTLVNPMKPLTAEVGAECDGYWRTHTDGRYIGYSDIMVRFKIDKSNHARHTERVENACVNCAFERARNPSGELDFTTLVLDPATYRAGAL